MDAGNPSVTSVGDNNDSQEQCPEARSPRLHGRKSRRELPRSDADRQASVAVVGAAGSAGRRPGDDRISVALPGLAGKELANTFDDMAGMGSWSLKLDPDFDGPARISWVEIDSSTVDFEVHEVLDDGGRIGEARVDVVITYEAFMHKADYAAARDDVDWWLDDDDWNDHYVTIRGEIKGTLTAHVAINGEEIEIEFQDVEGR